MSSSDNHKDDTISEHSILVTDLAPNTSEEALIIYFQSSRSQGGDVDRVVKINDQAAIVKFLEKQVKERVLEKEQHDFSRDSEPTVKITVQQCTKLEEQKWYEQNNVDNMANNRDTEHFCPSDHGYVTDNVRYSKTSGDQSVTPPLPAGTGYNQNQQDKSPVKNFGTVVSNSVTDTGLRTPTATSTIPHQAAGNQQSNVVPAHEALWLNHQHAGFQQNSGLSNQFEVSGQKQFGPFVQETQMMYTDQFTSPPPPYQQHNPEQLFAVRYPPAKYPRYPIDAWTRCQGAEQFFDPRFVRPPLIMTSPSNVASLGANNNQSYHFGCTIPGAQNQGLTYTPTKLAPVDRIALEQTKALEKAQLEKQTVEMQTVDLDAWMEEHNMAKSSAKEMTVQNDPSTCEHHINGQIRPSPTRTILVDINPEHMEAEENIILEVRGFDAGTTEDAIELFFENVKKSGGGDVKEIRLDNDNLVALITFEDPTVVERVLGKKPMKYNDRELCICVHQPQVSQKEQDSISDDQTTKTIKVSGLNITTSKETIEDFFVNKKRTGGGEIESVKHDQQNGVAFITFTENEVSQRVVEHGRLSLEKSELFVSLYKPQHKEKDEEIQPDQPTKTIIVSGLIPTTTKETIENFFVNKKRTGGGEIEKVEHEPEKGVAIITFTLPEDAQRVVGHGTLELEKSELSVSLYEPKNKRKEQDVQPGPRTIKVTGYDATITPDTLEYFFENERKSGGSEVESVQMFDDAGFALITFAEEGVPQRVLCKQELHINDCKLDVSIFSPDTSNKTSSVDADMEEEMSHSCCVKVSGFNEKTTSDAIENFFENRRASGGGPIENINVDEAKHEATIRFVDAQAVKRILQKDLLKLDGTLLDVVVLSPPKPRIPLPPDPYKLLVSNIPDNCTKDALENYLEAKSLCGVKDITYGSEPGSALITFEERPDLQKLKDKCLLKKLEGATLLVSQAYMTNAIQVHDKPDNCSADNLENYFENARKSNGGRVVKVDLFEDDKAAIVYFKDHKVVPNVLSQRVHVINKQPKQEIKVSEYHEGLGFCHPDHDSSKPQARIPTHHEFSPVEEAVLRYITLSEHHKSILEAEIREKYAVIDWNNSDGGSVKFVCQLDQDTPKVRELVKVWITRVDESAKRFFSGYKCTKVDILQEVWTKVIDKMNSEIDSSQIVDVMLEVDDAGCEVRITGVSSQVDNIEMHIKGFISTIEDEMKRAAQIVTETVKSLKEVQIRFMLAVHYPLETEKQFKDMKITVSLQKCEIVYRGLPGDISKAKIIMYEVLNDIKDTTIKTSNALCKLMMNKEIRQHVVAVFKTSNITVVWEQLPDNELKVIALHPNDLKQAVAIIKQEVIESTVHIPSDSEIIFQGPKWQEVVAHQEGLYQNLLNISVDSKVSKITIACTRDIMGNLLEIIRDFMEQNTILQQHMSMDSGMVRLLITHQEKDIAKVHGDLKDHSLTLTPVVNQENTGFIIAGTKTGLYIAERQLCKLRDDIRSVEYPVSKPGMSSFFTQNRGQVVLDSIEVKCRCTIEITDGNEGPALGGGFEVIESESLISKVVCQALNPDGRKFIVYREDMTKHKVDVIVNAANRTLQHYGGLAAAISAAGGSVVQQDCNKYIKQNGGELLEGQVATSRPGNMTTCKMVVHAVGPVWQDGEHNEENLLYEAVYQTLETTERKGFTSLAIPALSSGIFGYPLDKSTRTITQSVKDYFEKNSTSSITEVHLIDRSQATVNSFRQSLISVFGKEKVKDTSPRAAPMRKTERVVPVSPSEMPTVFGSGNLFRSTGRNQLTATTSEIVVNMKTGILSKERADVLVNSTNTDLKLRNGAVSIDLLKTAGTQLQQECSRNAPNGVTFGDVVVTAGYNLTCKKVFHGACKSWDGPGGDSEKILRKYVQNCLKEAETQGLKCIAFPAIGTGNLSIPRDVVAKSMFDEVSKFDKTRFTTALKNVTFVVYDKDLPSIKAFEAEIKRLSSLGAGAYPKRHDKPPSRHFTPTETLDEETYRSTETGSHGKQFSKLANERGIAVMTVGEITVQVQQGDITLERTNAIVNSTNKFMDLSIGAVAQAIVRRGGKQIEDECRQLGGTVNGIAVTDAGDLKCTKIIHVDVQDNNWNRITKQCLKTADSYEPSMTSIALPLFGTGQFGKTASKIAGSMLDAIGEFSNKAKNITLIRIVIFQDNMVKDFQKVMEKKSGQSTAGWFQRGCAWGKNLLFGQNDTGNGNEARYPKITKAEITLKLFALTEKSLENAMQSLDDCCDEESKDVILDGDTTAVMEDLTAEEKESIKRLEDHRNVKITVQERVRRIRITGRAEDRLMVQAKIESVFAAVRERESRRQQAEMLADLVQWMYLDTDTAGTETWSAYSKEASLTIETAFKKTKPKVRFFEGDTECEIDFQNLEERLIRGSNATQVKRIEMATAKQELPATWSKMPDQASMDLVVLPSTNNPEYAKVAADFQRTCGQPIVKISRVQNPRLWANYSVHKTHMEQANPKGTNNEQAALYHGTSPETIQQINMQGFNRSFCGKHATAYGKGVYFARDASYSVGYTSPGANGHRCMYQARVLTGLYVRGNSAMVAPPGKDPTNPAILYDSTVDNVNAPSIFVAFNDNQAYPEYLIEFQ